MGGVGLGVYDWKSVRLEECKMGIVYDQKSERLEGCRIESVGLEGCRIEKV